MYLGIGKHRALLGQIIYYWCAGDYIIDPILHKILAAGLPDQNSLFDIADRTAKLGRTMTETILLLR